MSAAARRDEPAQRALSCRCGAIYAPPELARLEGVRVIDVAELAAIVVRWPENTVVDVRRCACCGGPIARLVRH